MRLLPIGKCLPITLEALKVEKLKMTYPS